MCLAVSLPPKGQARFANSTVMCGSAVPTYSGLMLCPGSYQQVRTPCRRPSPTGDTIQHHVPPNEQSFPCSGRDPGALFCRDPAERRSTPAHALEVPSIIALTQSLSGVPSCQGPCSPRPIDAQSGSGPRGCSPGMRGGGEGRNPGGWGCCFRRPVVESCHCAKPERLRAIVRGEPAQS
jgi:hypothetical protein